jgi:hypothetical protein
MQPLGAIAGTVGIQMPQDFSLDDYNSIHECCRKKIRCKSLYNQFAAAWNAVAYRFRSMCEHDEAFRKALATSDHESGNRLHGILILKALPLDLRDPGRLNAGVTLKQTKGPCALDTAMLVRIARKHDACLEFPGQVKDLP